MAGGRHRVAVTCQLCDQNNTDKHPGGRIPRAVTTLNGFRICAKHLRLLHAIAKAAGVSTAALPPLKEVA